MAQTAVYTTFMRWKGQLWSLCKPRKAHRCLDCREEITGLCYRPLGNTTLRWQRLCAHCGQQLILSGEGQTPSQFGQMF